MAEIVTKDVTESLDLGVKRFYVPGVILKDTCEKCNTAVDWVFNEHYISYPKVNAENDLYLYCGNCDHEWMRKVLIKIELELVV